MNIGDRPNRIPWPPIVFLGSLLAANMLTSHAPLGSVRPPLLVVVIGTVLFAASVGLMLWAFTAFRAHNTSVLPNKRSDFLITSGPFGFSRNPIYLAEAILFASLALINGSIWYLMMLPPFVLAVTKLAVEREEAHLEARFGSGWTDYKARVRRWI